MFTVDAEQREFNNRFQMQFFSLEELVPEDHLLRAIDKFVDFNFIYDLVEPLYCENNGRPGIDPVTLMKIPFIQYLFGIPSMRQTIKEIEVNVAYRWFLGLSLTDSVPHFSTFGKNYKRRFEGRSLAEQIFYSILNQCIEANLIDTTSIFIDGTHVKACANSHKYKNEEVEVAAKWLAAELGEAIQEDRIEHGKKPLKEPTAQNQSKNIKISRNDPDAGWFHKGEHKQVFAYNVQTACDKHGWVLSYSVHAGNTHDTQAFPAIYNKLKQFNPRFLVLDAGYKTPTICQFILSQHMTPVLPYTRPRRKKENRDIVYDEYYDCYLDENNVVYQYRTTNRKGYREYRASKEDQERYNNHRVITRHVWQDAMEEVEDIRHRNGMKDMYKLRKETIERTFGTAKEHHGLRYTHLVGKELMEFKVGLTYACLNMKKLAKMKKKMDLA